MYTSTFEVPRLPNDYKVQPGELLSNDDEVVAYAFANYRLLPIGATAREDSKGVWWVIADNAQWRDVTREFNDKNQYLHLRSYGRTLREVKKVAWQIKHQSESRTETDAG